MIRFLSVLTVTIHKTEGEGEAGFFSGWTENVEMPLRALTSPDLSNELESLQQ